MSTGWYLLIALVCLHSGCVAAVDNWTTGTGTYLLVVSYYMVLVQLQIDWLEEEQSTRHEKNVQIIPSPQCHVKNTKPKSGNFWLTDSALGEGI